MTFQDLKTYLEEETQGDHAAMLDALCDGLALAALDVDQETAEDLYNELTATDTQ